MLKLSESLIIAFIGLAIFSCSPGSHKSNNNMENNEPENSTTVNEPIDLSHLTKLGMDISSDIPEGLKSGDKAPLFQKKDINGKVIDLSEMLKEGPVVIQFYRGQWCPVCDRYMSNFQDSVALIRAKGAKVIAITPETEENALKFMSNTKMDYSIINDSDLQIMNDYKVTFKVTEEYVNKIKDKLKADIAENNDADEAMLPVPATYIVKSDGMISYVQFDFNYKNRASVEDILKNL